MFAVEVLPLEDQISRAVRGHFPAVMERIGSLPDRLRLLALPGEDRAEVDAAFAALDAPESPTVPLTDLQRLLTRRLGVGPLGPALAQVGTRDLRVLDPACGSGHFILYAFDLFEDLYREAWGQRVHRSPERTPLWEEFPDERAFEREIPRLILAHNLYGVDIDPRCVPEAALTLGLRAQRAWQHLDVRPRDRPAVSSVNLVCAQAMPDAPQLLARLLERLQPAVLGRLAAALLTRAAELGVLQRAETAIADTVAAVRAEYLTWKRDERLRAQGTLSHVMDAPAAVPQREFAELDAMDNTAF